ncbi:MAG: PilX N-terminal domain-containing pilus assembly protein [Bacillota bacterium]
MLYISLLLLLILTLIGLAASRNTTFDERMALRQQDQNLAFQAAEAALRDGESLLQAASPGDFNGANGHYMSTAAITWETADWSGTGGDPALATVPYEGSLNPAPAHVPRFYLVMAAQADASGDRDAASSGTLYKVIAKGWGASASDTVVLESTYLVGTSGVGVRLSWRQVL